MTKEDIELVDALVWAGCLSRPAAKEVVACAEPGKVATFITERGLAPLIAPAQVIIERLAKREEELANWNDAMQEAVEMAHCYCNEARRGPTGTHLDCTELHDVCPHKPETD